MSFDLHIARLTRDELNSRSYQAFLQNVLGLDDVNLRLACIKWFF
jgi:hypothetical protein